MTGHAPTISLRLNDHGALVIALPGHAGSTRDCFVSAPDNLAMTLTQILQALASGRAEIGEDGAPTQAQVRHWEKHVWPEMAWPDASCRFCIAEGLIKPTKPKINTKKVLAKRPDGVEIARVSVRQARAAELPGRAHCRCGRSFPSQRELAAHLALEVPRFPRRPPDDFPHWERAARQRSAPETISINDFNF